MRHGAASGPESRVMVRPPDDVWSEAFREEVRRDRRFEASLMLREAAVLAVVVLVMLILVLAR
ncbi:MAG TPA: hypothetical protein VIJ20_07675 [Solirubrobacteraceae bacterium]